MATEETIIRIAGKIWGETGGEFQEFGKFRIGAAAPGGCSKCWGGRVFGAGVSMILFGFGWCEVLTKGWRKGKVVIVRYTMEEEQQFYELFFKSLFLL